MITKGRNPEGLCDHSQSPAQKKILLSVASVETSTQWRLSYWPNFRVTIHIVYLLELGDMAVWLEPNKIPESRIQELLLDFICGIYNLKSSQKMVMF
jgi:hypothetical protein